MTFSNVISPDDLQTLFPSRNLPSLPPQRRRTLAPSDPLINTPEDARLFLNLLNTLSTSPTINPRNDRLSVRDINRFTTVDTYNPNTINQNSATNDAIEPNMCAICRVNFEENDVIRTLNNCGHYFHSNCIDNWLELRNTCPICRHVITEDREQNAEQNQEQNSENTNGNSPLLNRIENNESLINMDHNIPITRNTSNNTTDNTIDRLD